MTKTLFIFFTLMIMGKGAYAEYRVYQYYIRSTVKNINPSNAQLVTSTLNPTSYAAYHGGKSSIEVNLLRSWVCPGNTSKKTICEISDGLELEEKKL